MPELTAEHAPEQAHVARERLVDRVLARVVEHVVEPEVEARLGVVADAVGTRLVALVDRDGVAVRVDGDVARAFFYSEMYYQALQVEMEKDIAAVSV